MWAVMKKEIKDYFYSPLGYIFIGVFMGLSLLFFYMSLWATRSVEYIGLFEYTGSIVTVMLAFLTMGMFSAERKNGTELLLFTSAKSTAGIVMGKFLAALFVIFVAEIMSLVYYAVYCVFAGGVSELAAVIAVWFGYLLTTFACISIGGFISSLTENQIIAAIATIAILLASWFLPNLNEVFYDLSPIYAFQNFGDGVISTSSTIILLSEGLMFTLLTITVLQRRRNLK